MTAYLVYVDGDLVSVGTTLGEDLGDADVVEISDDTYDLVRRFGTRALEPGFVAPVEDDM